MTKKKTTNVYYYQLLPEDENANQSEKDLFYSTIDPSIFVPKDSYFKIEHSDGFVNLYSLEERHNRYVLGTFVYIQTDNIPPSYNEDSKQPSELNIGEFDGLGYDSSFIYDRVTRIIGLESKKPGTSLKSVQEFIIKNFGLRGGNFKVVVMPDEYEKFIESREFSRLEIDLAIPNNDVGLLKPGEQNADKLLEIMSSLKATKTKIIMSNGHSRKRKLSLSDVKEFVNSLMNSNNINEHSPNIKAIKITGIDAETDHNHVFDLITNRLITQIEIDKKKKIGDFDIILKYNTLEGDYLSRREQLERLQL